MSLQETSLNSPTEFRITGKKPLQRQASFKVSRTDFDNSTSLLSLAILDNTDNIDLVKGRVTTNEAHIRFLCLKLSNIIDESFSTTNLRVDENKAYIVANENAIAENHDAIVENEKTIVGYSTDIFIIKFYISTKNFRLETSVAKLLITGAQCGYRLVN